VHSNLINNYSISKNKLTFLPDEASELFMLREFDCSYNPIKNFSPKVSKIPCTQTLSRFALKINKSAALKFNWADYTEQN